MLDPMNALAAKDANYFVMTSADGSKTAHRTVGMYVDNTMMYAGCSSHVESFPCVSDATGDDSMQQHDIPVHESCLEAAGKIVKAAKRWIMLNYTVGQGPEFSKYAVQMLTWKNVDGSLEPATSKDAPCTITVNDQFGYIHDIKGVEPDKPLEGLGFLRTAQGD